VGEVEGLLVDVGAPVEVVVEEVVEGCGGEDIVGVPLKEAKDEVGLLEVEDAVVEDDVEVGVGVGDTEGGVAIEGVDGVGGGFGGEEGDGGAVGERREGELERLGEARCMRWRCVCVHECKDNII
jgi:hypothetical protein